MSVGFAEKLAEHFVARQNILERYIDVCPIPCFIVTKEGETIFVNEAYQHAFNVRLDQADKRQWEVLIDPADRPRYVAGFNALIAEHKPCYYAQIKMIVSSGTPVASDVRIVHVPGNGYIGYIIFLCNDHALCPLKCVRTDCLPENLETLGRS